MGAVYRYQFYDWNYDQVYAEMKKFDFYTSWGHGAFKDFVQDYYEKLQVAKASGSSPAAAYFGSRSIKFQLSIALTKQEGHPIISWVAFLLFACWNLLVVNVGRTLLLFPFQAGYIFRILGEDFLA